MKQITIAQIVSIRISGAAIPFNGLFMINSNNTTTTIPANPMRLNPNIKHKIHQIKRR